jgi:hypothetical protein
MLNVDCVGEIKSKHGKTRLSIIPGLLLTHVAAGEQETATVCSEVVMTGPHGREALLFPRTDALGLFQV